MLLTVAFASTHHARRAMRLLAGSDVAGLAMVEISIPRAELDRLMTLLTGLRGVVIEGRSAAEVRVA